MSSWMRRWFVLAATLLFWSGPALADDRLTGLHESVLTAVWRPLAPGFDRLATSVDPSHGLTLFAYRFAPAHVSMRVVPQVNPGGSSAGEVAAAAKAGLIINAGFFWITPKADLAPTGWLKSMGKTLAPRKSCRACAGVVYADKSGIHIARERGIKTESVITDAVQVGPLLVERGAVITFKPDGPAAQRSAICLDHDGNVVVAAALSPLTLFELAELMQTPGTKGGFGCETALNLDGGPSTQIAVSIPGAEENLGTARPVQNFLAFALR